jgi:hypothetical protein
MLIWIVILVVSQCPPIVIAQYEGGECAYIKNGLLKKHHIDKIGSVIYIFLLLII